MAKNNKFHFLVLVFLVIGVWFFVSDCATSGGGGTVVYFEDFENYSGGWMPRGGASVRVVTGTGYSGDKSLLVTNRSKTWHGAIYSLASLKPGQTYNISVWAMFDDDSAPSQAVNISIQQNIDGQGETYSTIGAARLPRGEWVFIEGEYTVPRSRFESMVYLYFEGRYKSDEDTEPSDLFSFYVDDITITRLPPSPPPMAEKDIPSLHEFFPEFPLGAAIEGPGYFNPNHSHHALLRHFNVLVLGNGMKPDALQPSEGRFNWTQADALIEYAEKNDVLVRGHTLIWHNQTPNWFFQGSGPDGLATKEQLYARMERHIKEVVTRYKGKIHTWDVVNEVIGDDGEMRNSRFYQIVGSHEYIAKAFQWAHEADPDALLCLNDYSIESPSAKQDGFYNLLKTLLDEGVPVHVAGIQGHISLAWPTVSDLRQAIQRFASLGLKVQVTELDVSIYANSGEATKRADRDILIEQAYKYRALFDMFREEAVKGNLDMVVVWGLSDIETWLNNHPVPGRTDHPLFFGKDLKAKPAYWIIVDPTNMPIQIKRIDATYAQNRVTNINDTIWNYVSPRDIADNMGNKYGWFKVMWDDTSIYTKVFMNNIDPSGKVNFFIEPRNQKLENRSEVAFTSGFDQRSAVRYKDGYAMLAVIPFEGKLDARVGFDLRLENADNIYSWNDFDNSQEVSSLNYGTINLRTLPPVTYANRGTVNLTTRATRAIDPVWERAQPVPMNVRTMGFTEDGSVFRALWDDNFLYVMTEVADSSLDDRSNTVHEQDSVEVFVDQNNGKTAIYEQDDGQYRVNFRNAASFNGGDSSQFVSRTMVIPGGYRVEMAIPLYAIKPAAGQIIGFDVQINDATNGGRTGIRNWASNTNMGYQSTEDFGILIFADDGSEPVIQYIPEIIVIDDPGEIEIYFYETEDTVIPARDHIETTYVPYSGETDDDIFTLIPQVTEGNGWVAIRVSDNNLATGNLIARLGDTIEVTAVPHNGWKVKSITTSPSKTIIIGGGIGVNNSFGIKTGTFIIDRKNENAQINVEVQFERITR
ncbi:MAG: endo-1,4-beta-xylanase [Treponema sp.]|nr:endo-1,4-beta-xylanase [Treponema sp.]